MKKKIVLVLIFMFFIFSFYNLYSLTIKIGSIAPARSPWDKALKKISREWKKASNGKINLKIYPGGIAGSERAMIRKMKIGSLSGALLSNVGLTSIYPDFYVINIPLLIRSDKELDFVLKGIRPIFEEQIENKGYKVMMWSMAGWIKFFTKTKVATPDDLRKQRLFFTTGEPIIEQSWKNAGFNTIPIELKDLMVSLQSGMVNAFFMPPLVAASGQYFALAPNMMSLNVAPVYGAVVINKNKWERVPKAIRKELLLIAEKIAKELDEETKVLEVEAINTMKEHGLILNQLKQEDIKKWEKESDINVKFLKGKMFSDEIYQKIKKLIIEYRNS